MISLDGFLYYLIAVYLYLKYMSFIKIFLKVYVSIIGFVNQSSCAGNVRLFYFDGELKGDIFVIICQLHNINQGKLQIIMFTLFLIDFSLFIFFGFFVNNFGNEF